MKTKEVKKGTIKKKIKKESGIEMLARMMVQGFEKMGAEISSLQQGQNSLQQGQAELKQEVEGIKQEMSAVKEDQKEISRTVKSIERKQEGTLVSLDETVHRSEFNKLARRVEILES